MPPRLSWVPIALGAAVAAACARPPPPAATGGEIDLGREPETPALAPPMCMETEESSCGEAPPTTTGPVADETVWRVPVDADDPVAGPAHAPVTLVVFSDFECPHCRRAAGALAELRRRHPETVRVVWKDFPLPMHDRAEPAALFARAVRAQQGDDGFWKAHDLLFDLQPGFSDEELAAMAERLGASWPEIEKAIKARTHAGPILRSRHLGDAVDLRSTPTTFVNGRKVVGASALRRLDDLVADEAAKAERLRADGVAADQLYARIVADGHQLEGTSDLP